ncbi:MAG: hypothetical protein ACYC61_04730 [Isosphaeraceae bacterium]
MGYPRRRGVAFRLDDVLLAGIAAAMAIILIGRGHGAEDARIVIEAKTVVAGGFRLSGPENLGEVLLYVRDDGPANLSFHSTRGWFLLLGPTPKGAQALTVCREDRPLTRADLSIDESGAPSLTVAELKSAIDLDVSAVSGTPDMALRNEEMSSIRADGPSPPEIPFPTITLIKPWTDSIRLSFGGSDALTGFFLLGEDDGVKSQLEFGSDALPELSFFHGQNPSPVVQAGLDPMDRPFIRLNDQQAGTTRTLP